MWSSEESLSSRPHINFHKKEMISTNKERANLIRAQPTGISNDLTEGL